MDRKIKGFTLVELLVVIAIIAILLMIGIPEFLTWKNKKQIESDLLKLKSVLEKVKTEAFVTKKDLKIFVKGNEICIVEETETSCNNALEKFNLQTEFIDSTITVSKRGYFKDKISIQVSNNDNSSEANCIKISRFRVFIDKCS